MKEKNKENGAAGLGDIIFNRRKRRGLTQAQLAKRSAVSLMTITRVEHGHQGVSFEKLQRICSVLGLRACIFEDRTFDGVPVYEDAHFIIYKK